MYYRINYLAASKRVVVESGANAAPAAIGGSYQNLGTARLDAPAKLSAGLGGMQLREVNHVLYQHVQDALYKIGVQDMAAQNIIVDGTRTIAIGTGTLTVAAGANSAALAVTTVPTTSVDKEVVYTSSDVTKATVNAAGVVHGVAAGSAVITAKLKSNNAITATRAVTVTA